MRLAWICLTAVLVGCDEKSDAADVDDFTAPWTDDTAVPSDDSGDDPGDDTGVETEGLTYYEDIAPLMATHCTRCHYSGGQGTGDYTDKDNVISMAEIILGQVESGLMPPPVADPDCRTYKGYDHLTIDAEEKQLISDWIDLGMPEGDPGDLVEVEPIVTELSDPDMEVYLPAPYTPTYSDPSNPGNEYRCFIIDPGMEETFYVTALAPILDQRDIVHHIVLFKKSYSEVEESELGEDGYDCIGSGMADGITGLLAGWAPGGLPVIYEEGQGMPITPTDRLVMQVHYFQGGPDAVGLADQSGYAFRTAVSVDTSVMMYPFGPTNFRIPAGDDSYTASFGFPLPYAFDVIGTFPHMHVLGTGYKMMLQGSEGSQCLVEADQYDFNNQHMFMFEEPAHVNFGDTLNMECTWNNSTSNPGLIHDPPIDVYYGERTDEEMCFAFTLVAY
jgi:hypothetical protein